MPLAVCREQNDRPSRVLDRQRRRCRNGRDLAGARRRERTQGLGRPQVCRRPRVALVDRSLAGSDAVAADARAQGLRVVEFSGDVAGVWMRELEPRLRAGPLTIVGHTSAATLFCLDFLARDYGARTVRRAEHGAAVSFVISQRPGRRAALTPAAVRAQWSDSHA